MQLFREIKKELKDAVDNASEESKRVNQDLSNTLRDINRNFAS